LKYWSKNIKLMITVICMITLLLLQSNHALANQADQVETVKKKVIIDISVEEYVYLLVPTTITILVKDTGGDPTPYIPGKVLINGSLFTEFTTSNDGKFSFMWTPEKLAVYNLTVETMETENYATSKEILLLTVEFSFEELLNEAIRELEYIKDDHVLGKHNTEKKISTIEKDLRKALEYYEKEEYLKAFLRIRHATHLLEKLVKHYKFTESLSEELKHIAYKLVIAVRYKVEEDLKYADDLEECLKKPHKIKTMRMKVSNKVLLELAQQFYDRGINEINAERYSKAISRFIVAYRLVRIVLRCEK